MIELILIIGTVLIFGGGLWWLGKDGGDEGKAGDVKGDAARLGKLAAPFDPEPFIRKAPAGKVFMGGRTRRGWRRRAGDISDSETYFGSIKPVSETDKRFRN